MWQLQFVKRHLPLRSRGCQGSESESCNESYGGSALHFWCSDVCIWAQKVNVENHGHTGECVCIHEVPENLIAIVQSMRSHCRQSQARVQSRKMGREDRERQHS